MHIFTRNFLFLMIPMTIPTLKRMIVFEPNINIYLTQYESITPKSDNIYIYMIHILYDIYHHIYTYILYIIYHISYIYNEG